MINTQYINLNIIPSGVMPVLYCSQYDIGRPLGVVVYNGAESVDLSGYTCTIEATRTDKTPVTAAVITSGNIGVFETTATMTNQADTYKGKLVLTDGNGKRVASLAFVLVVTVRTMDEDAEEIEEDASLYQQYTETVQTIIASIRADLAAEIIARQNAISTEASTRAAAVSAEASARQSADNTLQSNINAEASTRATQDASLQSQIDQLIAPSGEAPSAAEVENARIGADGVTYPTLGDAIRANDSLLKSHFALFADDGKVLKDFIWEQGLIEAETGLDSEDGSTTRCRTAGYYSTDCEEIVVDRSVVPYGVFLYYYDENHNFVSPRSDVYISSSITPNKNYPYFRIAVYYYGHGTWAISAIDCANRIKIKNTAEIVNDINADIVKAVGGEDTKTNLLHNLVNYNYNKAANLAEESGSQSGRCIGIVRNGTIVKLNGTAMLHVIIRLNGMATRVSYLSPGAMDNWNENPVSFIPGHTYRLKIKTLSGTSTKNSATYLPSLAVYKVGTHSTIGTLIRKDTEVIREFTPDASTYNIALYIYGQTVLTDYVASVTIEDCTLAEEQGIKGLRSPLTLADADYNYRKVIRSDVAEDNADGTRLRIIYKLDYPFSFSAQCVEGRGLYVALYETLGDAVKAGDPTTVFTPEFTTDAVSGESELTGYLGISLRKTDDSVITDADRVTIEAATNISILLYPLNVIDKIQKGALDKTTTYLNEDVETAIVPCTGFNTFISGDAASFVTGKTHFSFAAIADVHGTPDAFERYIQYANEHKRYLDAVLCLGDIVQSRPSNPYDWFGENIPNSEVPFLFTVGNHDVAYTGASAIPESEARARYFPEIIEKGWLEAEDFIGTDRCSWYKDFSDYSIRVISIYEYGNSQTSSSAPQAYCRRWLDSDVLQWFADTLYTTPTGYSVIVLLHQIPYAPMDFVVHPFCVTESIAYAPDHWTTMLLNTVNGNPIEDIVNAFINSSNISQTYNSIASYQLDKTATVSKDFSGRSEDGKFVAYFCGHTHASYVFKSRTYPNQICIGVPSGSASARQRSFGDMLYDPDNRNMDNFYIVGIDTSQKKINLVQIGGHATTDMREGSFGTVSY